MTAAPAAPGQAPPLDAAQSDPRAMGWMQGFPPPPDKRITQPDSVYFSFPRLRWSVCHMRQLLPSVEVSRGLGNALPLAYAPAAERQRMEREIDALEFKPLDERPPMTWAQSLAVNYTDGMLVLHHDQVVYERYSGCLAEDGQHAAMSMTKSLTGLLSQILVAEGALDEHARVADLIPEVAGSAFADATVRQVLDMTTGLHYSEDYSDPDADIWKYSAAASPLPKAPGYSGPDGYFEYLAQVRPEGRHGEAFHYRTVNADMAGWLVARASGKSVAELASQRLWRPMGAEQSAYILVDGIGTPYAGGGLSAGLRDLGRLGLLMLNEGRINGQQLFPAEVVRHLRGGGDRSKFGTAYPALVGGSYTSLWWVYPGRHEVIAARGVHGQTIYVDFSTRMVLVRLASFPKASNPLIDPTSIPAFQVLADYLQDNTPA